MLGVTPRLSRRYAWDHAVIALGAAWLQLARVTGSKARGPQAAGRGPSGCSWAPKDQGARPGTRDVLSLAP